VSLAIENLIKLIGGAFGSAVVSVKLGEVVVADRHVHVAARAWRG